MVLLVHDGPWAREGFAFDGLVQLLANRGYAVLRVNVRGSTGFGKRLRNAGHGPWGRAMQDDLSDAVAFAVRQGWADRQRVAIVGFGYGGYAAVNGLATTPALYACGVDVSGPVNLATYVAAPASFAARAELRARMGDPEVPAERAGLAAASLLPLAARVRAPLLIVQGERDALAPKADAEQLVAALQRAGRAVTYLTFPDEGHALARSANRRDLAARVEAFLARCLGGRVEGMPPGGYVGSSAVVRDVRGRR
jgi:dipeptidyl aminopeptidase/acylaminoacyl peptidase